MLKLGSGQTMEGKLEQAYPNSSWKNPDINSRYYHYSTGDPSVGSNYEEVLPKVKAYHDSIRVPFGHWQFDSWFYPKVECLYHLNQI